MKTGKQVGTAVRFGTNAQAKRLLHEALTRATQDPTADWPLDLAFDDPEEAANRLTTRPRIVLTPEDVNLLKQLGKNGFTRRFDLCGGAEAVHALVECLERMDMAEVST
jgi:hypothetical protein